MTSWKDFNDAKTQTLHKEEAAFSTQEIKSLLTNRLREALHYLLPAGVIRHGKFVVGDIHGNKGDSLVVELSGEKVGQWHDFATGEGGDVISLWASVFGKDTRTQFPDVISSIHEWLGTPHKPLPQQTATIPEEDLGPITGKWDYHDADGNLIACVYRYDPPSGKQFRPWDVKTRRHRAPEIRPLYNQQAIKSAKTIVLVEGEKAAQALIDAGICATTAMNGANAPIDKTDWSPLSGKHVIIWPDNDTPGFSYALNVAARLKTLGVALLAILSIPQDKPAKWDAADAVSEGMDIGAFLASATRVTINPTPPIPAFSVGYYLDDDSPTPPDIIAPRILTPGGLLVLGGAPKVGKSDLLIHWLAYMAMGLPFLGMTPPRPLKIFCLQSEIGYVYLRERLRSVPHHPNLLPLFKSNLVITPQIRMLLDEQGVEKVIDTIAAHFTPSDVDVIVIDPLRNVYDGGKTGGENDNSAMLAFLQDRVEAVRHRINPQAGVILAHHTKKITKKFLEEDPFQSLSGAGSLRSFYTTGIVMFRPDESQLVRQMVFELRNGTGVAAKFVDKVDGRWCEIENHSERLVNKDYGQKLDAERRRKQDQILEIIFEEGRKGTLYTPTQFCQAFENKAGLGGKHAIRDRIDVLATKSYIKFNKDTSFKSKYGVMCVEGMSVPDGEETVDPATGEITIPMRPLPPTHFKEPGNGAILPVENPSVWVYQEDETA